MRACLEEGVGGEGELLLGVDAEALLAVGGLCAAPAGGGVGAAPSGGGVGAAPAGGGVGAALTGGGFGAAQPKGSLHHHPVPVLASHRGGSGSRVEWRWIEFRPRLWSVLRLCE